MLALTHLGGFGFIDAPVFTWENDAVAHTNSPSWEVDLGPPGKKQIIMMIGRYDGGVSDQFTESATFNGSAMTNRRFSGYGDGSTRTIGVGIYTYDTTEGGAATIASPISGFTGTMDSHWATVLVVRGYSTTPVEALATFTGDGGRNGDSIAIDTVGANLVVVAGATIASDPGVLTGSDTEVTTHNVTRVCLGYVLNPGSSAARVYDFSGATDAIVCASFALA